ncbi:lysostaphin resistance A-like protein [Curtobacterium sp. RRHDQ10]|uniref:CPBP family intramembrane glutamic endopeptidase n=1 Tax=Curtobacterium phyllosphaerae TaxID=3413379 RepID=UPI003BF4455A
MTAPETTPARRRRWPVRPSVLLGLAPLVAFAVVSAIHSRPSDDYADVGTTIDSVVHRLILPETIAGAALAVFVTAVGWWRIVLLDRHRGAPAWAAIAPVVVVVAALARLPFVDWHARPLRYFLLLAVAVLLVGFFEELLTRGVLLVGLRARLPEFWVWLLSSALFGLLHLLNILAGAGVGPTILQVLFAASFGSVLYVARRVTRSIAVPMLMHALWDFGAIGVVATGIGGNIAAIGILGLLTIVALVFGVVAAVFVALHDDRPRRLAERWRTVPPREEFEARSHA